MRAKRWDGAGSRRMRAVLGVVLVIGAVWVAQAVTPQDSATPASAEPGGALLADASQPASASGAEAAVAAQRFGRDGTVKVRIDRSALTPELIGSTARLVAEYESFVVVEAPADALVVLPGVEVLPEENLILLNAGPIDTTQNAAKQLEQPRGEFGGKALQLVQFAGPIQPDWVDDLARTGVEIVTYIPSNAYLVYGDCAAVGTLQSFAEKASHVQWQGAYLDEYKLDPVAVAIATGRVPATNDDLYAIQLVQDPQANADTLSVVDSVKSAPILSLYQIMNYTNIVAKIPPALVAQVAAQPDVVSIQPYYLPQVFDERQNEIVRGNLSGNNPGTPGYLAWLSASGFTQAQFTSSAFVVDVSDSAVDQGTTTPNHFGLWESGVIGSVSHVTYARRIQGTTVTTPSPYKGCDGHGNLNAHVICGYDDLTGFPFVDASGYHYGLGVCPFTKVGSSVIFTTSGTFTSPNYTTLQSYAYHDNARISSNSWGNTYGNTYNSDSQAYDYLVRDAQPSGSAYPTAGNQQMVILFAAGNSGSSSNTVHPPATAKNIITVGAGEGVQAFGGADYNCGIADSGANSANDVASFSSRGPCSDSRKKPDIMAPGSHISGGVVQSSTPGSTGDADACFDGSGVCGGYNSLFFPNTGQEFYTASSGTSHSTPCVAGGAALIRQFFINEGMSPPTPAMTKAVLMNSARYMTGSGAADTLWSNSQGMGEMNLSEAIRRGAVTPTVFSDEDPNLMFTVTGQTRTFNGSVSDVAQPFRVTLVWTDAPGPTSGSAYKNNLDLTVVVGGNTYKGNVFSGANSTTGGSADTRNNVESVFLAAGVSGSYTVTVTATNINSDGVPNVGTTTDQDFALVIYNSGSCSGPTISGQPSAQAACTGGSASFTVTASGTPAPTYRWRKGTTELYDGNNVSGAATATLTLNPVGTGDAATTYNCVVTNTCSSVASNNATLTVNTAPSVTGQPTNQTACSGGSTGFSVTASGTPAPTYRWRIGTTELYDGNNISGAATATLTINPVATGNAASNYNCVVTNTCGSATSNNASLTVNVGPSIGAQPGNQTVCSGGLASFSVTASGTPAPTYRWRIGTTELYDGNNISGAATATLTINPVGTGDAATNYNCVVTNTCSSVTSNNATLTVNTAASVTGQPTNQTACSGGSASFSVTASGTPAPTYRWRMGTTELYDGNNVSGAATATLTINPVGPGDAASNYNCVVTNTCGSGTSNSVSLTVNVGALVTGQPIDQTVCSGEPASFSVTASGTPTPTYRWRIGTTELYDGNNISGAATATLTINPVATGNAASNYNCVVTNACGSNASNDATLAVEVGPTITDSPADQLVPPNGTATFSVIASGSGTLEYRWRKDTLPLMDGNNVSGAFAPTLIIDPVGSDDVGSYDVMVTNACGSDTSQAAQLTLAPAGCPGDSNCDGVITWRDIDYFIAAQNDSASAWAARFPGGTPPADCPFANNDLNTDGHVTWRDIDLFVVLMNTTCP